MPTILRDYAIITADEQLTTTYNNIRQVLRAAGYGAKKAQAWIDVYSDLKILMPVNGHPGRVKCMLWTPYTLYRSRWHNEQDPLFIMLWNLFKPYSQIRDDGDDLPVASYPDIPAPVAVNEGIQ